MAHPTRNSSTNDPDRFDRERSNVESEPSSVADDRPSRRGNRLAEEDAVVDDDLIRDDEDEMSENDIEDEGLGRSDR